MAAEVVRERRCPRVSVDTGLYFFGRQHYEVFVSNQRQCCTQQLLLHVVSNNVCSVKYFGNFLRVSSTRKVIKIIIL